MQRVPVRQASRGPLICGPASRRSALGSEDSDSDCSTAKAATENKALTGESKFSKAAIAAFRSRHKTPQSSEQETKHSVVAVAPGLPPRAEECQTPRVLPAAQRPLSRHCTGETLTADSEGYREKAVASAVRASVSEGDKPNGLSNQFEVKGLQPLWSNSFMSPSSISSEKQLGLTTMVSTVGAWVAAAFEEHEEEDEYEEKMDAGSQPDDKSTGALRESLPAIHIENAAYTGLPEIAEIPTDTLLFAEAAALPQAGEYDYDKEPLLPPHGRDLHPQVLLHLCGQPAPILWRPNSPVPLRGNTIGMYEDSFFGAQEIDPLHMQVSLPINLAEAEGSLEAQLLQKSFDDIADIEMWLLDTEARRLGSVTEENGSACSSDSSDEEAGQRLFDLACASAYIIGGGQAEEARNDSEDGLSSSHEALTRLQSLEMSSASIAECSSASSFETSIHEDEVLTTDDGGLHIELPRFVTEKTEDHEDASTPTILATRIKDIDALCRYARTRKRDCGLLKWHAWLGDSAPQTGEGRKVASARTLNSERAEEEYNTILASSASGKTAGALECTETGAENTGVVISKERESAAAEGDADAYEVISLLAKYSGSELTNEEAVMKEAAARSLTNRIWTFFGGASGAEDSADESDGPTSGDAVEETIEFEDPAVVQRDDHRTFPNEAHFLFESINQEPRLQVLSPQQQKYVASLMHREVVAASTSIVEEGAEPMLLWCSSGEFDVTQAGFFGVSVLRSLVPGDFFGVEELVTGEKLRCALKSRQTASECTLWILDRELFLDSVKEMLAKREAFVPVAQTFLHMVRLVRDLPEERIAAVAKACKVERFAEGQTVFKMGFHGDMFCFIYKGEAITQKPQDDGKLLELARQGRGEYFGEMALIRNTRRTASVVAGTELILLCLDKDSFETLLAPLKEKMDAKAASSYKRQDDAPPTESKSTEANIQTPGSRDAGEACVKKRTRKSSLALINYLKHRDQEKRAEEGQGDIPEDKPTARWQLAQEPETIHQPPPLSATGSRSCLKGDSSNRGGRGRKSPVRFDESSLLPSETSSDEG